MKFYSRALAGTALGLFVATLPAAAMTADNGNLNIRVADTGAVLLAQADTDAAPDRKKKREEIRKAKQAEKQAQKQQDKQEHQAQKEQNQQERQTRKQQNQQEKQQRKADQGNASNPEQKLIDQRKDDRAQKQEQRARKQEQRDMQKAAQKSEALDNAPPASKAEKNKTPDPEQKLIDQQKALRAEKRADKAQKAGQQEKQMQAPDGGQQKSKASDEQHPAQAQTQQGKHGDRMQKPGDAARNGDKNRPANSEASKGNAPDNATPANAAPVLDSDKRHGGHNRGQNGENRADQGGQTGQKGHDNQNGGNRNADNNRQQRPEKAGPPPKSDASAQDFRHHGKFESIDAQKGKRIEGDHPPRRERPKGADVLKEIGSRVILNIGGQTIVQSTDQPRLRHHAKDVYYEDLPQDRRRETIERPDGSRVVTIRNEYGDVIRRSRFTPDGREIRLVYVDDQDLQRDRNHGWRDPGDDLPPMRLTVPVSHYILDSEDVHDSDRYYQFLDQPPVEKVERLYSLGDVKRSARLRDKLPRIDLDTINFETGSADISSDQVDDLQGVAEAMKRIIDRNPAETFLIEGHTDAVGSEDANLALSDERAESVASVLTDSFDIPPENMTTQGYGEDYLKVDTDGPSRENRRVAIRRITPLVSPVAQQ